MTVLPDPTSDLGWSDFRGAIHDIFEANAQAHLNRTCVIETASEADNTPERTFTYDHINRSSNVVAHYLIDGGIQRGDVVMIYAYRGVDLVVAVMGVLKAGATFSVIDPLYPPERQKIYLEVAQPRGLINIEKATREAGPLSRLVRDYIDKELSLKAEIPSLRLQDDGTLAPSLIDGKDVFDHVRSKSASKPGVVVGPDSNPTLSFTSGSEGRPKGVLGRHFSLAYYFSWMKERFELSENSKFTMLSGIAHDPIQRDIFTPLFLGATLLVPSKDDIQHERLAEWMKKYGATVTHLTPAMGQILVGGATAEFPALERAFFVGDILTKRDCNLLRKLAPNVNIVNMYGTTETQRAVSYFEIPSRNRDATFLDGMKDVIPAGRGMNNVQLLVVDTADRTKQCGVGEQGEIYVRAGGLAEGYLGDPVRNAEKFVQNWFVDNKKWIEEDKRRAETAGQAEPWREFFKGPRDRLYRTGDLGRYLPSGDVECTGRADDQVKIRGFRIELGDINTHLGQHPLIRDCVTLLRRDKDEEPTLVSYIVPEFSKWSAWLEEHKVKEASVNGNEDSMASMLRRFRPLQNEVRRHLKGKLPAYAVPTHFIPLKKLPLNPNGKVDKPALPFPDIVDITAAADADREETWDDMSKTEQLVATTWGNLIQGLNPRILQADDSFFDLGGHSILAQQMLLSLRRSLNVAVPMAALFRDPTLKGFSAELDRLQSNVNSGSSAEKTKDAETAAFNYASDAEKSSADLAKQYQTAQPIAQSDSPTVFLTGASGFLGAFLLRDLLSRTAPSIKVIAHVRAKTAEAGLQRLQDSCEAYGVWKDDWKSRISCVVGDLAQPLLGLSQQDFSAIAGQVDIVIHNGALVHWVYPYTKLRPANVQGTLEALKLCATGKAKSFTFVSSTSVLDTEHFADGGEVLESDDLKGSAVGLGTGYGQSKWASEYLVRESGRRGLRGAIVRPGYILGDSLSGVTNTDDFLVRMLKGCIQLKSAPQITNTINMVPVDHVARVVVASSLHPPTSPLGVVHVTGHPRLTFNEYLSCLPVYGYDVKSTSYNSWTSSLEQYVSDGGVEKDHVQHALMPLYHFVTNDLPANTRAAELNDANTVTSLRQDAKWTAEDRSAGAGVTLDLLGVYIAYLIEIGFLDRPTQSEKAQRKLPSVHMTSAQRERFGSGGAGFGGRGAMK